MTFAKYLLVAAFLLPLVGQEAKIIIVERKDTAELKAAYGDYKAAQAKWEKAKADVAKRYTTEAGKTIEGWDRVQFSVDFRAMVPAPLSSSGYVLSNSNITATPAIGRLSTSNGTGFLSANPEMITPLSDDGIRGDLATKEK